MKSKSFMLYHFSCSFIQILSLLFTGLLFVSGFLFTCYADDMVSQQVQTMADNPFFQILGTGVLLGLVLLCCRLFCKKPTSGKKLLLVMVFGWIALLGGILILFGRTAPAADAWSVYSAAESLAMGDTSVIHPTDSYLSYYPQQVGLMAFFEFLIRLWKLLPTDLHAYHFIKCLYVVLTCIIVYYQYASVHLLWKDDRADCIYLILAGANLPLIMYSSFVYGETPSFAALSVGLYYLLKLLNPASADKSSEAGNASETAHASETGNAPGLRRRSLLHGMFSLIALTLAVMLRKNSLIIIIAVILVTVLEALKNWRPRLLLFAALCAACSLTILPATQKIYELRSGSTLRSGVPAMSYFAMGMQESSRGNGWYNGFNFNTYQETGMDTAATADISRQYMDERTDYFREHPGEAVDFYWNKYLSQWADGTYASRQATLATLGGRHPLVETVYSGANSRFYIGYGNLYQTLIYLGCFAYVLNALLKKQAIRLYEYLGIIGVLGGFLFHMIWEANARYIFLYGLLLLPYAACGISRLSSNAVLEKFRKNNTVRRSDATEEPTTAA